MIKRVLVYAWFGPFRIEEDDGSIWEVNLKNGKFEKVKGE
jgi:hypothetical protein